MTALTIVVFALLGLNVGQAYWISRLIDRLMSRNYFDFAHTNSLGSKKDQNVHTGPLKIEEQSDNEDLGYLGG